MVTCSIAIYTPARYGDIEMALVEFAVADDVQLHVVVEVDDADAGLTRIARAEDGLIPAGRTFEAALATIEPVAAAVAKQVRELSPDEAHIEMGFKLSAQSGAILAKAGGDAHIVVKLCWKRASA
jgi:hypothetical protein